MFLGIDIGNTNIVYGIFSGGEWLPQIRVETSLHKNASDYERHLRSEFLEQDIKKDQIQQVVISSVVPGITNTIEEMVHLFLGVQPFLLKPKNIRQLQLGIQNPSEIGSDLVANALAAVHKFKQACIVVDFGTALTFTVINDKQKILGVSIAPGIKTAMKALSSNTAQLPEIPLVLPDSAIGKNTVHAIQAGILVGYVGMVEHMIKEIKKEMPTDTKIIATGGLSSVLKPLAILFDEIDLHLTLKGLKIYGENYPLY
ncbi:type III pantothenate kinase [Flexithrix dorotheae]|uniref:type III pantothenate kinase n=1 Tax=Flexithrix dorotheae TaxID=70993 RepID=UPI00037A31B2|nr:type III pantothenate kinase [Flexithrix dorotheae]